MRKHRKIFKEMIIMDVLQEYPETFDIFMDHEVGCAICHAAEYETIEEGIGSHGIDVDKFVDLLNEKVNLESNKKL